jgi:nicotinate-nucleotide adenylyltransferase
MKVILFGGAFDPPHLGHQSVAQNVLSQKLADELWYVPVRQHSFQKEMSSPADRLAMLQLLLSPGCRIETYELETTGVNYTFNTLDALSAKYPQHQFAWLIGSDNLASFHKWGDAHGRDFRQLLATYRFYVYPRAGYPYEPLYDGMIALENMPMVTVSSTQVRAAIMAGLPIDDLVPPAIVRYMSGT